MLGAGSEGTVMPGSGIRPSCLFASPQGLIWAHRAREALMAPPVRHLPEHSRMSTNSVSKASTPQRKRVYLFGAGRTDGTPT